MRAGNGNPTAAEINYVQPTEKLKMMDFCAECGDLVDVDPYYVPQPDGTLPINTRPILCGYTQCVKAGQNHPAGSSPAPLLEARLRNVKVLFRAPETLALWAIPYEMRPGQQPGDLFRAHRDFVPPPPGHYGSGNIDLSDWIYLGSPGWFGSITGPDQEIITAWLSSLPKDAIPQNPYEWSKLADFQ